MATTVGRRVGVLGGGQLGRMLCEAAAPLGISVVVLDPATDCPAARVAARHIVAPFTDAAAIDELSQAVDVITVEIEHVNAAALARVSRVPVHPAPETIALVQDKYAQKLRMREAGVPVGEFEVIRSEADVAAVAARFGYPLMLKSRTQAYDGRGNVRIDAPEGIHAAYEQLSARSAAGGTVAEADRLYAERWVPFVRELAVLVCVDVHGATRTYPTVETVQKDSICHTVIAPAPVSGDLLARAGAVSVSAVSCLRGAGVFGVELFQTPDGSVLLNEIAPRVHNSGHFTIEACVTSQFEQHLRAVTGAALGDTAMRVPAACMLNVLGTGDFDSTWAPCARALSVSGASVHWYCKATPTRGRKMGHVTVTGHTAMEVRQRIAEITESEDVSRATGSAALAPLVGIIMGSDSDLPTMAPAAHTLREFGVPFEITIVSAHRTPQRMMEYATSARARGLRVIIAAAGGAAHLPGMVASMTCLPVVGVPVPLKHLDGVDSLHSIVQMPRGIPVACVAIGNAVNAALLAVRILGSSVPHLADAVEAYAARMETAVLSKVQDMERLGWEEALARQAGAH